MLRPTAHQRSHRTATHRARTRPRLSVYVCAATALVGAVALTVLSVAPASLEPANASTLTARPSTLAVTSRSGERPVVLAGYRDIVTRRQVIAAAVAAVQRAEQVKQTAVSTLDVSVIQRLDAAKSELAAVLSTAAPVVVATDPTPSAAAVRPSAVASPVASLDVQPPALPPGSTPVTPAQTLVLSDRAEPVVVQPAFVVASDANFVRADEAANAATVSASIEAASQMLLNASTAVEAQAVDALATQQATQAAAAQAAQALADQQSADLARRVEAARTSPNGQVPVEALCPVVWAPDFRLRCDAEVALERLDAAYRTDHDGHDLGIISAYRSFDQQAAVKATRGDLALPAGQSQHGAGVAVDFTNFGAAGEFTAADYLWMKQVGQQYGWAHLTSMEAGGTGAQEPWHWEFTE